MRSPKTSSAVGRVGLLLLYASQVAGVAALLAQAARAQVPSETAQVTVSTGQVSVDRAGELWALSAGQTLEAGQTVVTGSDGYAKLGLPDGSVLEVFPDSRLVLHANQSNWRDLLDLYLGKVRFQIQHVTGGAPPLRVTSPTAVISVRGTVFDVEVDPAQETVVSVETGTVSVRHRLLPGNEVFVEAGQSLRIAPSLPPPAKGLIGPLGTLGQVVRAVGDAWAQISVVRGSSVPRGPGAAKTGGTGQPASGGTSSSPASTPTPSNSGSNQTAPPPGNDKNNAPPGDVIP